MSIHSSRLSDTSIPGESTKTTSSRKSWQRVLGQWIRTRVESPKRLLHNAWAKWLIPLIFWRSVEPSQSRNGSFPSSPSTYLKKYKIKKIFLRENQNQFRNIKFKSVRHTGIYNFTCKKQFVVWPIPDGNILSPSIALITVLLPFDVLPKNATY